MLFMRDPSRAFAVAWLGCLLAACSFTSSGSGGPGSQAVSSSSSTVPTNGHPSTPGAVDCNGGNANSSENCTPTGSEACCTNGSNPGTCESSTATTCANAGQWLFQCDEAADCSAGEVCCLNGNTFSCATTCAAGPQTQSCRLNTECGQSAQCIVQSCNGGVFAELCQLGNGCTAQ
jgi:hypothetical protein